MEVGIPVQHALQIRLLWIVFLGIQEHLVVKFVLLFVFRVVLDDSLVVLNDHQGQGDDFWVFGCDDYHFHCGMPNIMSASLPAGTSVRYFIFR